MKQKQIKNWEQKLVKKERLTAVQLRDLVNNNKIQLITKSGFEIRKLKTSPMASM